MFFAGFLPTGKKCRFYRTSTESVPEDARPSFVPGISVHFDFFPDPVQFINRSAEGDEKGFRFQTLRIVFHNRFRAVSDKSLETVAVGKGFDPSGPGFVRRGVGDPEIKVPVDGGGKLRFRILFPDPCVQGSADEFQSRGQLLFPDRGMDGFQEPSPHIPVGCERHAGRGPFAHVASPFNAFR